MMLLSTSLSASPSGDTSPNGYRFVVQRYSLDNSWRRPKKGNVLIAGSPLRIFRLSAAGQSIAESLEQTGEAPASGQLLITRLIDARSFQGIDCIYHNSGAKLGNKRITTVNTWRS